MCTILENQLLTVPVSANGVSTRLIIDTGSSVNIISSDFAKKLSLSSKQNPGETFIKGISGNIFSPIGQTGITLEFASTRIVQKFLIVKDSPYELLGGLPFCRAAHLLIDFLKKTLQIEADVFELQVESSAPVHNDVLTARCKDHVRIEPRTEMVIEVKVPRKGTPPRRTQYHLEEWTAGGPDFDKCGVWGWNSSRGQSYKITGDCAS